MSLDKINGSPLLHQGILENTLQKDRIDANNKQSAKAADMTGTGSTPASGDTAEISDMAHRLMELRLAVDTGRISMAALPEVRQEKVTEARERLKSGFYNSLEVREKVASGVASVFRSMDKL